jgi:hypothetical protein
MRRCRYSSSLKKRSAATPGAHGSHGAQP